ncbi:hypothetical protein GGP41_007297, partial [Bipolaris sorokiniana]
MVHVANTSSTPRSPSVPPVCHEEQSNHPLMQTFDMTFICKKCKKAFRKDAREFEDAFLSRWAYGLTRHSDEYCPHCDNHFVLEAKTPKASLQVEGEDVRKDSRH